MLVYPAIIHPLPDRVMWKQSQTALPTPLFPGESESDDEKGRGRAGGFQRLFFGGRQHVEPSLCQPRHSSRNAVQVACSERAGDRQGQQMLLHHTSKATITQAPVSCPPSVLLLSQHPPALPASSCPCAHQPWCPKQCLQVWPRATKGGVLRICPSLGTHISRPCSWISSFLDTA